MFLAPNIAIKELAEAYASMIIDPLAFDLNDPLLDSSHEVFALEDYLATMEEHISHIQRSQKRKLNAYIKKEKLTPDDSEWHEAIQEYYHWVDFLLPRFFRGPFLVSLYALYESVVTEIADLIHTKQPRLKRFSSFRSREKLSFLKRARKYYDEILGLELCPDETTWYRLTVLSELRNAVAHANGRVEMLRPEKRSVVQSLVHSIPDIDIHSGYITFGKAFVSDTAYIVISDLRRLIDNNREGCRPDKIV